MIEDWERQHNESWIDRWTRLTGVEPKNREALKATKKVNGENCWGLLNTIQKDAGSEISQEFRSGFIRSK